MKVAHDVLGERAIAVTASSCSFPKRELGEAEAFCRKENIRHFITESEELEIEGFAQNPKNRCYLCKHELFEKILKIAEEQKIVYWRKALTFDDNGDYRPGLKSSGRAWNKKSAQRLWFYQAGYPCSFEGIESSNLGKAVLCLSVIPVCLWRDHIRRETYNGG